MNLIFRRPIIMILGILVSAGIILTSCDEGDDAKSTDFSVLQDSVDVAIDLLNTTEEGPNDGQYSAASRAALQTAITAAQAIVDDDGAKQQEVNNAVVALHQAMETYRASEIQPVAAAALVAHWSFDEGSGTTAHDNSANGFDGTLKSGHANWGAGFPEWAEDRHGDDNKALYFNEGANIEIPYNTNLNPSQMSISLWINADEINENNRFMGMHSWNAYKFQLQSTNRPFFTVATDDNGIYDRDAELALPIQEWHHIAVTFGGGSTVFYVDGVAVKTFATPGEAKSIADAPYSLVIGQDFPTNQYAATDANYEVDKKIPLAWGGYFRGFLDEVRIYNTVLTATQVETVYNREKPE